LDSKWVSPAHCIPKDGAITIIRNGEKNLIPTRTITGYSMRIDFRKLNKDTKKVHKPPPLMEQVLERRSNNSYYCFLDGYSGYTQISIQPEDQEKKYLLVHMVLMLISYYPLTFVMLLQPFRNVFSKSLKILLKILWKYFWMILLFTITL
jgi:hypothetical protein